MTEPIERMEFHSRRARNDLFRTPERHVDVIRCVNDETSNTRRGQKFDRRKTIERPSAKPFKPMLEGAAADDIETPMPREMFGDVREMIGARDHRDVLRPQLARHRRVALSGDE